MKGVRALLLGVVAGSLLGAVVLCLGAPPFSISFVSFLVLFSFSSLSLVLFSLLGWPNHSPTFDYYDLHRFVIGLASTCGSTGIVIKIGERISRVFSLSLASSFGLAVAALAAYLLLATGIYYAIRLGFGATRGFVSDRRSF